MSDYDYDNQEEEIQKIKDKADARMREYYNNNPKAKSNLNKIMMKTFGAICFIILIFIIVFGFCGK